jgi:hypothetical protein
MIKASLPACGGYNYDSASGSCLLLSGSFSQASIPENNNVPGTIAGVVTFRAIRRQ